MAGPLSSKNLFQNIVADKIVQTDHRRDHQYKDDAAFFENENYGYKRNNPKGIKILFDGDERHKFLHHWGLKMRVDPVE